MILISCLNESQIKNIMEEANQKPQNGAAHPAEGTSVPKGNPQNENPTIKEADPNQQRPKYGADAGENTANGQGQLPSLNDGATPNKNND